MSKKTPTGTRLAVRPKIKPLPAGKRLAPYRVPDLPAGKSRDIEGQAAMDFGSGEWDGLTDPE